jgi:hypothetical protein
MRLRLLASPVFLALASLAPAPAPSSGIEAAHAENEVYQTLQRDGLTLSGIKVAFPAPRFHDGDSPEAEKAALRAVAGSAGAVQDLLSDSPVAPEIFKIRSEKAADGTLVQIVDLWFAVHARLADIKPDDLGARKEQGKPVEAANMKFQSTEIGDDMLKERGIERKHPDREWYTHLAGDMLGRIHVEATDRVQASQSEHSWVLATRTDPRFDADPRAPNHWRLTDEEAKAQARRKTKAAAKAVAAPRPYAGGASTTKISELVSRPGILLVEGHFAYAEPKAWFDGEPTLSAKIPRVVEHEIRELRRDLAERKGQKP